VVHPSLRVRRLNPTPRRTPRWLAAAEWLLIVAGALIHAFLTPHVIYADGEIRYDTLLALVKNGAISAERYSILQSLLATPFYYLGDRFGLGREAVAHFCVTVFLASLVGVYFSLRRAVAPGVLRRMLLILLFASMFGRHVQTFYGETLTACGAMLGVAALVTNRPGLAGIFFCFAVVNTPTALIGLALCNGAWALWTRRWFQAAWPLVASLTLVLLEFWWRRGSPFLSGYAGDAGFANILPTSGKPGFSYPAPLGVLGQLFSFGKGVLFFAPGLLLYWFGARRSNASSRRFALLGLLFTAGVVIAYSQWWSWYGGWFWGPRFLLFASVPASFLLAERLEEPQHRFGVELTLSLALIWSAWVGVNGAVFDQSGLDVCRLDNFRLEALCWYVPEFSALFRPFFEPKVFSTSDLVILAHAAVSLLVLWLPRLPMLSRAALRTLLSTVRHGL
jgi:hypothetical protein